MDIKLKKPRLIVNRVQFIIGISTLFFGSLVYFFDRQPNQIYFYYIFPIQIPIFDTFPNLFGPIGYNLPAFFHVFSFILLTSSLLFISKSACIYISLSWFFLGLIFELGQKYYLNFSWSFPDWFEGIPFLENTENYFLQGTYDLADLFAITLGTIMAYLVQLATTDFKRMF